MINEHTFIHFIYDENYYYYNEFLDMLQSEGYKIFLTQYNKTLLFDFENCILKLNVPSFDNDERFDIILNKKFHDELSQRKIFRRLK